MFLKQNPKNFYHEWYKKTSKLFNAGNGGDIKINYQLR